jgi:leucyl/phenylalanyl-tRNA--protein transferase
MIHVLTHDLKFPSVDDALEDGLLCIGGDLSPQRVLLAYQLGIFPWSSADEPICWYSPDPRFVLFPDQIQVSKSMQQVIRKGHFTWTCNQAFSTVVHLCRIQDRNGQQGTWIYDDVEACFQQLHLEGHAHSFECWCDGQLVGGLYGILVGRVFCGESMFSKKSNASKFAFIQAINYLKQQGVQLIDCQVYTSHLDSLGAVFMPRAVFIRLLRSSLQMPALQLNSPNIA